LIKIVEKGSKPPFSTSSSMRLPSARAIPGKPAISSGCMEM